MTYTQFEMTMKKVRVQESPQTYHMGDSSDVADFARNVLKMETFPEERFYVICLNTKGKITGFSEVSKGTLHYTVACPREIFRIAVAMNAASIILLHNHPSFDPTPSNEDIATTEQMVKAGDVMGIPVLDHIIIAGGCYCSLGEMGYINH